MSVLLSDHMLSGNGLSHKLLLCAAIDIAATAERNASRIFKFRHDIMRPGPVQCD